MGVPLVSVGILHFCSGTPTPLSGVKIPLLLGLVQQLGQHPPIHPLGDQQQRAVPAPQIHAATPEAHDVPRCAKIETGDGPCLVFKGKSPGVWKNSFQTCSGNTFQNTCSSPKLVKEMIDTWPKGILQALIPARKLPHTNRGTRKTPPV